MKIETNVLSVIPRTPNVLSIRFPRPEGLEYKAGQFFFVTLRQNNKELVKHFSFSSSPTESSYIEFTKKLSDSEFSQALRTTKTGDWARIDAPYGKFTFEGEYQRIALLSGGIGITPFRSICKFASDKKLTSKIALFYSCRTPDDIVFRQEFEVLAEKNRNLRLKFTVNEAPPDWKGSKGIIDADMIKHELPDYTDYVFYSCGPPAMVKAMQSIVEKLDVPKEQFKQEYFSGYA